MTEVRLMPDGAVTRHRASERGSFEQIRPAVAWHDIQKLRLVQRPRGRVRIVGKLGWSKLIDVTFACPLEQVGPLAETVYGWHQRSGAEHEAAHRRAVGLQA